MRVHTGQEIDAWKRGGGGAMLPSLLTSIGQDPANVIGKVGEKEGGEGSFSYIKG